MKKNTSSFCLLVICLDVIIAMQFSMQLYGQGSPVGEIVGHSGNVDLRVIQDISNIAIKGNRAYIDWKSFNVENGHTVNFNFDLNILNGVILNRVKGNSISQIDGTLNSSGHVYLINPNGLMIGNTGAINASGFTASTLNLSDSQMIRYFRGEIHSLEFSRDNKAATIENRGTINIDNGHLALIGSRVINAGRINVPGGNAELFAADHVTILHNAPSSPLITVAGTSAIFGGIGIDQSGAIDALAARLEAARGNVYALAINNTGVIQANAVVDQSGKIMLVAIDGTIRNSGKVRANGQTVNHNGGEIIVDAGAHGNVELAGTATETASFLAHSDAPEGKAGLVSIRAKNLNMDNALALAYGKKTTTDNSQGIMINGLNQVNIRSSLIGTTDADINITAGNSADLGIHPDAVIGKRSTLINAFNSGDVSLTAKKIKMDTNTLGNISVGSNVGNTNVTTTAGDLEIYSKGGGSAQIGYHFHDNSKRFDPDSVITNPIEYFTLTANLQAKDLYLPAGNINVHVNGNIILNTSYGVENNLNVQMPPASFIGHGLLPSDFEGFVEIPIEYQTGGNITVNATKDVLITSDGMSAGIIGHYVNGYLGKNIYPTEHQFDSLFLHGNVFVDSGKDIIIRATNGGNAGIGHSGDFFHLEPKYMFVNGLYKAVPYEIKTSASRNTVLEATGSRSKIFRNSGSWRSVAQIGHNISGESSFVDPAHVRSSSIVSNIEVLSGANVILKGDDKGGFSVIGHENNIELNKFHSFTRIAFGLNRYRDLTQDGLRNDINSISGELNAIKKRFAGKEEGYLHVDGHSMIGHSIISSELEAIGKLSFVGLFGFRIMKDDKTTAIRFDNGASFNGICITNEIAPGVYDPENFSYCLGNYPGSRAKNFSYDPLEHYGYCYADFMNGNLEQSFWGDDLFKADELPNALMFYPLMSSDVTSPPPFQSEKLYYPMFGKWRDRGEQSCCSCQSCRQNCRMNTTGGEYIPSEEEISNENVQANNESLNEPTLAME